MLRGSAAVIVIVTVVLIAVVYPAFAQGGGPPEWMNQIDPAKYVLLAKDIKPPFAYGTDPEIQASGQGVGIDDGHGNVTEQTVFFMYAVQNVKLAQPYANTAKTNPPTPMKWDMGWQMTVGIYQNEEAAKAAVRTHYLSEIGPFTAEDENCLNDARLGNGRGAAGAMGRFVRYRNLLLKIDMGQVGEVKSNRKPIDSNLYYAASGDADSHQQKLLADLARLWLDKVAGPDRPDLHVRPDVVLLRHWDPSPKVEREPVADQQYVQVWVQNRSNTVAATGVEVQLLLARQGDAEMQSISRPIRVADIQPGKWGTAEFYWDLGGKNLENATLRVVASRPGQDDMDPVDNQCDLKCSIYFAQSATTPFRWVDDSYSFLNYGYTDREGQELVEGLLATIIGQLYTDPQASTLLTRLMFPQTYTRLMDYLRTSVDAGAGGHCFGLAATAGLYFMDPALRPGGGRTCDMSQDAASANVNIYQRAQLLPLVESVLSGDVAHTRDVNSLNCLNTVRNALKNDRQPVMIEIFGSVQVQEQVMVNGQPQMQAVTKEWGHALLAYKLVEAEGRHSAIYVYDPNLPPRGQWGKQDPSSAFGIDPTTGGWLPSSDMKPLYDGLNAISAKAVVRQISLAEANAVMPTLKAKLAEMISWFHKAKRLMAMLHCPADVLFTDSQGRRVGVLNGQQVNEIPGAEIRSQGEVEIYVLPSDLQYAVTITGTGQGQAGLDIIRAESATKAGLTSFDAVPTAPGSTATASLLVGGKIDAIMAGGQAIAPKIVGTMEGDSVTWKTGTTNVISPPPKPVDTPQPGQPGTLIVCRKVVNGQPQNAADSFTSASEVWCLATYTNIPQNTTAECVWKRNGQEITRSQRAIGGNGWVAFSINTSAAGGLQAGTYTVAITAGTASLGTRQFTIGASQPGAATQPSSQPPSGVTIPVRGGNLLTAAQLPSGLKVPAGTTARASQAPFAVGRPFFGGNGEVFLFSGDPKAGQILYSPAVGVGHTCCESSILQGGNWRGGAYRDGKFIISVDYAPAAGNSTSGVFELKLDGSNRRLALQRDYGGLGDLIEAPQGGFYFTEFESGENIFHLAAEGQAETPLVKQNWPGGIVRLGYDRQSKALYGLNWGREWWGGSVNGVFRLAASGDMQLVSQAAAGTTFDDMAISPGGPFAAGPYVMDATNGRILRIVSGGSPVAVITGLRKPQSMGFHPTTGQMMVVCDGNTLLWVTGPTTYGGGQPGGTQTPAQITTPAGGGPAISLAGGSSSQPGPTSYPKSDGFIRLDVKYTKPGVVFDTVGINAATRGDFTLSIGSDGNLLWQIWNPDIQSKVRLSNGWHLLTGNQPLQAGKWYSVLVTYGTRGFKLKLGRTVMAHDDVVLSLSGNPIYLGDYPGDNHWGANYSIYRSFAGEVRGLEFGQ